MANSKITLVLEPFDTPPSASAYGGGLTGRISQSMVLPDGNGSNQMKAFSYANGTLAASGTTGVDLLTDTDRYGVALAATDVVYLYAEHLVTSLASAIHIEPHATNGWVSFIGATGGTDRGKITLRPGDFVLLGSKVAGNQAVGASNKVFTVVNDDAVNIASFKLQVGVRR